jgi:hypothetical protein
MRVEIRPIRHLLIGAAALFLATGAAHATADFCVVVTKTPDGFLALREGPGTQFKMIAKLKPGYPLDADTAGGGPECAEFAAGGEQAPETRSEMARYDRCMKEAERWTRVWIAERRSGWVYSKYIKPRDCPED